MRRREFMTRLGALMLCTSIGRAAETTDLRGNLTRLTRPGSSDNRATYLPDGMTLLFASRRTGRSQIWAMDPDGRNPRRLHKSVTNDYGRVAPSPDGSRLSFSSDLGGQPVVCVLDTGSGRVTPISDPSTWSFGPSWSSHDRIVYFSRAGGNRLNLWTVSPDATDRRQITNLAGESRQPWWSPDGATLAFSADNGTRRFQLWLAAADGTSRRALTTSGSWLQPFWSPDGRRLAASAKLGTAEFQILVIDADGSTVQRITQPAGDNVHPAWSPDGRSIVFTAGQGEGTALWRFDFGP